MMGSNSNRHSYGGHRPYWLAGDYLVTCDRCGFDRRASDTVKEWTGLRVCKYTCLDPRHPQDFVRGRADVQAVPDPRPQPNMPMLGSTDVTASTIDGSITVTGGTVTQSGPSFLAIGEITANDL